MLAIFMFSDEADDYGRLRADLYRLKHCCFPDGQETEEDVAGMIVDLARAGFLAPYVSTDHKPLLWIRRFHDYQPMRYWALSRLDRHPDDEFAGFDTKKGVKTERPLSPAGYIEGNCANLPKLAETCGNSRELDAPIPIPIPIPTPASPAAPFGARGEVIAVTAGTEEANDANDENAGRKAVEATDKVRRAVTLELNTWNKHDGRTQAKAEAEVEALLETHEGQVLVLASIFDTAKGTKPAATTRWRTLRRRMKGPGGGSPEGRQWAKRFTG